MTRSAHGSTGRDVVAAARWTPARAAFTATGLTGGAAFGEAGSAAGYPSALRASADIAAADLYLFSSPGLMGRLIAQGGLAAPPDPAGAGDATMAP